MKKPEPWFYALGPLVDKITPPPGFAESPLPWVNQAREQGVRSLLPKEVFTDAVPDTITFGKVMGAIHAVFDGLDKMPEPTPEQATALDKVLKVSRLTPQQLRKLGCQWLKFFYQFRQLIRKASDLAHAQGFDVARDFQRGYVEGVALVPAALNDATHYSRNQKLLNLLTTLGPLAQAFPSVARLHETFVKTMGEPKAGDLKNFSRLTRQIGLKLRPPGRPRRTGTAPKTRDARPPGKVAPRRAAEP